MKGQANIHSLTQHLNKIVVRVKDSLLLCQQITIELRVRKERETNIQNEWKEWEKHQRSIDLEWHPEERNEEIVSPTLLLFLFISTDIPYFTFFVWQERWQTALTLSYSLCSSLWVYINGCFSLRLILSLDFLASSLSVSVSVSFCFPGFPCSICLCREDITKLIRDRVKGETMNPEEVREDTRKRTEVLRFDENHRERKPEEGKMRRANRTWSISSYSSSSPSPSSSSSWLFYCILNWSP